VILVDTSVWIDHLRQADPQLVALLADDEVGCHSCVIQELALGSIRHRAMVLELLGSLHQFPVLSHAEVMALIGGRQLWGAD
jgi:predicted nucleic acid-binding protein